MDDETRNIIAYVLGELNQVFVRGGENITHMDIAMQGLNQLLQKPKEEPKAEEKKEGKK